MKKLSFVLLRIFIPLAAGIFAFYNLMPGQSLKAEIAAEEVGRFIDREAPVITLKGDEEVSIFAGDKYIEAGFAAEDNADGDLSKMVTVTGAVDSSCPGLYAVTYEVADNAGNTSMETRTVKVKNRPGSAVDRSVRGLPILMYHWFYDSKAGEKKSNGNWMKISEFEEQMKYLWENDYYFPSWEEVCDFIDGVITLPEKSVVVTIDDGHESFFRLAVPVLEKYNITATSFVITGELDKEFISQNETPILNFGSHSHNMHEGGKNGKGLFLSLPYEDALMDVSASKEIVGSGDVFCYPYGHYSKFTKTVLKDAEYKLALTVDYGKVYPNMDKLALPRIRMSAGEGLSAFISRVK